MKETSIYVIHALQGYEYHEKRVEKIFTKYKLDFEFVYDGDPSLIDREILKNYFTENFIRNTSAGALSCTLNHIFAYRKLIESGSKYGLVFENDPCFLPGFKKNLKKIYKELDQLKSGFIISLENTTLQFPSFFQTRKNRVLYRASAGRMAGAYLIDKEGAQNAIEDLQMNRCNDIVDWWHRRLIERNILHMYWAHPPLVEQGSHNGMMSSTISSKSSSRSRRIAWLTQKYYKMYIRRLFNQSKVIEN